MAANKLVETGVGGGIHPVRELPNPSVAKKPWDILYERVLNVKQLMDPQFHQFLINAWEELGKPPVMEIDFIFGPIVFVIDPELANGIVRDTGKVREHATDEPAIGNFEKSSWTRALGGKEGPVGEWGIFARSNTDEINGITYAEIQRPIMAVFKKDALKIYSATMVDDAIEQIKNLPTDGTDVDLAEVIGILALNTATKTLLSTKFEVREDIDRLKFFLRTGPKTTTLEALLSPLLFRIAQLASNFIEQIPNKAEYLKERDWLYSTIIENLLVERKKLIIESRLKIKENPTASEYQSKDVLDYLINAMLDAQAEEELSIQTLTIEGKVPPQRRFTDETIDSIIKSQIATFLLAGQETSTSQEVSVADYLLDPKNAEVLAKVQEELQTVLGGRRPTYEDLPGLSDPQDTRPKLRYLEAVVNYVTTLYPAVFIIPRQATKDLMIGDFFVKAGTQVFPTPLLTHRALIPNLESGGPEIFLDPAMAALYFKKIITFGKGRRACSGEQYARLEIMLHIATLFGMCKFERKSTTPGESGPVPLRSAGQIMVEVKSIDLPQSEIETQETRRVAVVSEMPDQEIKRVEIEA